MEWFKAEITGVSPLLMRRFTETQDGGATASRTPDRGTPSDQAAANLYHAGEQVVFPAVNVFRSIIEAGTYLKIGRKQISTARSSLVPAGVSIREIDLPVHQPWVVDSRAVRMPATGGRVMRHRPRFDAWKLAFTIGTDTEVIDKATLRKLVNIAGSRIGIGDFRPSTRGPFGRFKVTQWEVS
ncbi:MAG: hypothetical protein OXC11_12255 [Rhodospirillales bacterium]|nr:hypothetical protein [Rhodospirillales bacterium]